jgi:DNA-binding NarL/FixJ family response regulator
MSAPITLFVVIDDHTLLRRGLVALLSQHPDLRVVGEAGDAGEALRLRRPCCPQVILLDNHLPGVRGVDAIAGLREASPGSRVVMLIVSEDGRIWPPRCATAPRATCSRPSTASCWPTPSAAPRWASRWSAPR